MTKPKTDPNAVHAMRYGVIMCGIAPGKVWSWPTHLSVSAWFAVDLTDARLCVLCKKRIENLPPKERHY